MTYKAVALAALFVLLSPVLRADSTSIQAGCDSISHNLYNNPSGTGAVVGQGSCGAFGGSQFGGTIASSTFGGGNIFDFDSAGNEYVITGATALPVSTTTSLAPSNCPGWFSAPGGCVDVQDAYGTGGSIEIQQFTQNGNGPAGFLLSGMFTGGTCLYTGVGDAAIPAGSDLETTCNMSFAGTTGDGQNWNGDFSTFDVTGITDGSGTLDLQATPEPGTSLLFCSGFLLIGFLWRKTCAAGRSRRDCTLNTLPQ